MHVNLISVYAIIYLIHFSASNICPHCQDKPNSIGLLTDSLCDLIAQDEPSLHNLLVILQWLFSSAAQPQRETVLCFW